MAAVIGKDGVETEIQVEQMRQTLGKLGFDWLFNKH
jgi:sensor c-di-GMP phosphodiesterase-like protein